MLFAYLSLGLLPCLPPSPCPHFCNPVIAFLPRWLRLTLGVAGIRRAALGEQPVHLGKVFLEGGLHDVGPLLRHRRSR